MVGHRFGDLKKLLAVEPTHLKALRAAEAFDQLHRLRRLLCHGTIDVRGKSLQAWRAELHMVCLNKGVLEEDSQTIDNLEAAETLRQVQGATARLVSRLDAVIASRSTSN